MTNYKFPLFLMFVSGITVIFCIGGSIGQSIGEKKIQKQAIYLGYGQFNPTNGLFEWKTNK